MKTYKIHLIRHGLTEGNLKGQYIGKTDLPLASQGEAELLRLADEYGYPQVGRVFSSPRTRCLQTAALIYPGEKLETIERFAERDFGCFEGKAAAELKEDPVYRAWMKDGGLSAPEGGEDTQTFVKRVSLAFNDVVISLMKDGVTSAALCVHGAVIMAIMTCFVLPERDMFDYLCANGKGYTLNIIPSIWMRGQKVECFGEIPTGDSYGLDGAQAGLKADAMELRES